MADSANNRRFPRVTIKPLIPELCVHLQTDTGATDTRRVKPHDMSRTGMGFIDTHPVKIGTRCTVLVSHMGRSVRIIGKVTNCRPHESSGHIVGVKFTTISEIPSDTPGVVLTDDPAVGKLLINF